MRIESIGRIGAIAGTSLLTILLIACSSGDAAPSIVTGEGPGEFDLVATTDSLTIPEGTSATIQVRLSAEPPEPVTLYVGFESGGSYFGLDSASEVEFETSNWNEFQSVVVRALTDSDGVDAEGRLQFAFEQGQGILFVALLQQDAGNVPPPVSSSLADWAEGGPSSEGATRDYYNRWGRLVWEHPKIGDYTDANGVEQGSAAFATAELYDDDKPEYVEWDVTTLVKAWVDQTHPNKGFLLRPVSGSGTFNFFSREHSDENQRPELVLETQNGTVTIPATADTFLEPSTYRGAGTKTFLKVSGDHPLLIRFDLSDQPEDTTVARATLRLFVESEFGSSTMECGVFRCSQGHERAETAPVYGLARDYPGDAGIEGDADVYLFTGFESENWKDAWTYGADESYIGGPVSAGAGFGFEEISGRALQVQILEGNLMGLNMGYKFQTETGSEPEEVHFRYYIRFASDWAPVEGGKLPGIAGTYSVAGWGGRRSDGTNGWSARGKFQADPPASNPLAGRVQIGNYVYHTDQEGLYGDNWYYSEGYSGLLEKDRWYCIEQHVKMNDPAGNDGVFRAWVDGRLAFEKTDMRWRTVDTLKIERIWMNVYHGGLTPMPKDGHLWIDNVVVAKRYIGPIFSEGK